MDIFASRYDDVTLYDEGRMVIDGTLRIDVDLSITEIGVRTSDLIRESRITSDPQELKYGPRQLVYK